MKKLFLNLTAVAFTLCAMCGIASMSPVAYADVLCADGNTAGSIGECYGGTGNNKVNNDIATRDLNNTLNTIINVIIGIVGFVAVVMMIMGGINFITSQGDTAKVTKARNTILYGVVGLIVALLAFAIVNFVLSNVFKSTSVWL